MIAMCVWAEALPQLNAVFSKFAEKWKERKKFKIYIYRFWKKTVF